MRSTMAAALCLIVGPALAGPFDVRPDSYYAQINRVLQKLGAKDLMVNKGKCSKAAGRTVCDFPYTSTFSMRAEGPEQSGKRIDRIELRWSASKFTNWPDQGANPESVPDTAMGAWFIATSIAFDPEFDAGMRRSLLVMLTRDALLSGSASQEGVQARYGLKIQKGVGAVVSIEPK